VEEEVGHGQVGLWLARPFGHALLEKIEQGFALIQQIVRSPERVRGL
jgi:hypothetical protein